MTIEEKDFDGLDTIEEKEANAFASEVIIPSEKRKELRDLPLTQSALVKFAFENDISVGLLIGQMQHAGLIEFRQLNGYKRRYKWEDIL